MEEIFTEKERNELTELHTNGNMQEFASRVFQKAKENSGATIPDDYFATQVSSQLEDLMDNPVFSFLPSDQLAEILYMSMETSFRVQEEE